MGSPWGPAHIWTMVLHVGSLLLVVTATHCEQWDWCIITASVLEVRNYIMNLLWGRDQSGHLPVTSCILYAAVVHELPIGYDFRFADSIRAHIHNFSLLKSDNAHISWISMSLLRMLLRWVWWTSVHEGQKVSASFDKSIRRRCPIYLRSFGIAGRYDPSYILSLAIQAT